MQDNVAQAFWLAAVETLRVGNFREALRLIAVIQEMARENPQSIRGMVVSSLDALEVAHSRLHAQADDVATRQLLSQTLEEFGELLGQYVPLTHEDLMDAVKLSEGIQVFEDPIAAPWNYVLFRTLGLIAAATQLLECTVFDLVDSGKSVASQDIDQ